MPELNDVWYRYMINPRSAHDTVEVKCYEYKVKKVNPRTVTIWDEYYWKDRRVLINARKQYANPTKELALAAFIARSKRRVQYLQHDLTKASEGLLMAEKFRQTGKPMIPRHLYSFNLGNPDA